VLYCGDDRLEGAAAYLAGTMRHFGIPFDYLPSDAPLERARLLAPSGDPACTLVVLSDYPSGMISPAAQRTLVDCVARGTGLLMVGGWGSFRGVNGKYDATPIGGVLPVAIESADDRMNTAAPCVVVREREHPVVGSLPFDHPPSIAGFNRVGSRPESTVVLSVAVFGTTLSLAGDLQFAERERHPLLVLGQHGAGRTSAYASDVAPHWAGGLIDWGQERLEVGVEPGAVEIGNWYAGFFRNLLLWTMHAL
jgi:hypothetical protein